MDEFGYGRYGWARATYGDWQTINLLVEWNACRAHERLLDFHVTRAARPPKDEIDALHDILTERGVRFLPMVRARPPRW